MNIREAQDVNTLLGYLCEIPEPDGQPVPVDLAQGAAERLADRAYAKLGAGVRAVDVAETPLTGLGS